MAIEIRPLCDALGAEVIGADLTKPLLPDDAKSVDDAFLEHHLLCFRSDPLEAGDFARVATYFGEPQLQLIRNSRHDETPEVSILTIGTALVPLGPVLKQMLMDKRDTIDAAIYQYFGDLVDVPTIFGMSRTRLKPPFFIFLAVTFIGVYLGSLCRAARRGAEQHGLDRPSP